MLLADPTAGTLSMARAQTAKFARFIAEEKGEKEDEYALLHLMFLFSPSRYFLLTIYSFDAEVY